MNKSIITIFAILFVPFLGLPVVYDRVVYVVLSIFLAYFLFTLLRKIRDTSSDTKVTAPKKTRKSSIKKETKKKESEARERTPLISAEEKDEIKKAVAKSTSN